MAGGPLSSAGHTDVSQGPGQPHSTPSLRTCLCFLARAAKQSSSHFSSEEQLGNLLPAPFPLPSSLSLPPLLQSHSHICICAFQPCNEDQKGCCDGQNWSSSRWILMKGNLISTAKLFNEPLKLQPQIMHIQNYAFVHRRGKISKTGSPWSALKANPCLRSWFPISMCAIIQAAQPAQCIECTMALEGPSSPFPHYRCLLLCLYIHLLQLGCTFHVWSKGGHSSHHARSPGTICWCSVGGKAASAQLPPPYTLHLHNHFLLRCLGCP